MRNLKSPTALTAGTALVTGLLLCAGSAEAQYRYGGGETQSIRAQFGLFEPDGDSQYWTDKALDFSGGPQDFEDNSFGVSYVHYLGDRLGVQISASGFEGNTDQFYLDFVEDNGANIGHTTDLETTAVTVGLLWHLVDRDSTVIPYVGVGGGLYAWELVEDGDFIDFDTVPNTIFNDRFISDGDTFGYYLQAGLEVPLGETWSIFAEGRWHSAEDDLEGDFAGFGELDLSGQEISGGFSWTF